MIPRTYVGRTDAVSVRFELITYWYYSCMYRTIDEQPYQVPVYRTLNFICWVGNKYEFVHEAIRCLQLVSYAAVNKYLQIMDLAQEIFSMTGMRATDGGFIRSRCTVETEYLNNNLVQYIVEAVPGWKVVAPP